jgi:two-component system sensor histidine kinase TctE
MSSNGKLAHDVFVDDPRSLGTRSRRSADFRTARRRRADPLSAVSSIEDHLADEVTVLARAYAEVETFVGLLAHEVRTRLKVAERALARADEEGLQIAGESTRTLQELVEDLLELARARPDARANAGEAMRLVLQDLGDSLEADIVVGELPTVALPLALLRTVLRNLVVNALEAGASRVEVFAGPDGAICVRDDGPGVSPAVAAKIFGAYSGKFGGAGLGLTFCREILRQRGGELWLETPSTFCFRVR